MLALNLPYLVHLVDDDDYSDGRYGLWLDANFEKGVSNTCPTFGNEPLSDDGTKFDILGVEMWYIGS